MSKNNENRPVFIHAMFRTGSTYLWDKFRKDKRFHCYYEPLHEDLAVLAKDNIDIWGYRESRSMRHPELNIPYHAEYEHLLNGSDPGVPYFKKAFSYDQFCRTRADRAMKRYIDLLICSCGKKIPVLQFNRTSCRIKWFKESYPDSINLYLFRDPRDQWQSFLEIKKIFANIFPALTLLTASKNKEHEKFKHIKEYVPLCKYTEDTFARENIFYHTIAEAYNDEELYFIFYYIWLVSLLDSIKHSDYIVPDRKPLFEEYFLPMS